MCPTSTPFPTVVAAVVVVLLLLAGDAFAVDFLFNSFNGSSSCNSCASPTSKGR